VANGIVNRRGLLSESGPEGLGECDGLSVEDGRMGGKGAKRWCGSCFGDLKVYLHPGHKRRRLLTLGRSSKATRRRAARSHDRDECC
jgi:hypothetical protein